MKIDGKNYNFDEPQNNIGINEVTRNNKNLKSIFAYFDKNKDNKLCAKEVQTAFDIFSKLDNTAGEAEGYVYYRKNMRLLSQITKILLEVWQPLIAERNWQMIYIIKSQAQVLIRKR